jgi:hypothetical protein
MRDRSDIVGLAEELAEIARTTRDAVTGARLMHVVDRLLEEAGLPPPDDAGGGETPTGWLSEPVCRPA